MDSPITLAYSCIDNIVEPIDPDFKCSVCLGLCKDAVCLPCSHTFCQKCVSNETRCPECRANLKQKDCRHQAYNIRRKIGVLSSRCNYGCSFVAKLQDVEGIRKHSLICPYKPTQCPYCSKIFSKVEWPAHKDKCPKEPIQCSHCLCNYPRSDWHFSTRSDPDGLKCPKFQWCPLMCKDENGDTTQFITGSAEDHRLTCKEVKISCDICVGAKFKRSEKAHHDQVHCLQHVEILSEKVKRQDSQIMEMRPLPLEARPLEDFQWTRSHEGWGELDWRTLLPQDEWCFSVLKSTDFDGFDIRLWFEPYTLTFDSSVQRKLRVGFSIPHGLPTGHTRILLEFMFFAKNHHTNEYYKLSMARWNPVEPSSPNVISPLYRMTTHLPDGNSIMTSENFLNANSEVNIRYCYWLKLFRPIHITRSTRGPIEIE